MKTWGVNGITKRQVQLIHIARQQTGMSDDDYRTLLDVMFGVDSSKHLNYVQAERLIEEFRSRGFRIKRRIRNRVPKDITQLPSREILKKIEMLRADVRWQYHDGYDRWIKKRFGIDRITTMQIAQKVLEGLKAMAARERL